MQPISSANLYSQTINDALAVQTQWSVAENQQASGLQAQDFGTLGGSSSREMLNLETEIAQAQNWASVAKTTGSTTQAMYTSVGDMATVVNKLQTLISQATSSPDNSALLQQAQQLQSQLMVEVNQQVGGSYLFAGSNTSVAPVSLASYPAVNASTNAYDPTTPDTSYYTGDNKTLAVQVNLQQTISYGVTAANPAIEEAMRAIQSVIAAAQVSATTTTTETSPTAATAASGTLQVNNQTFTIAANQSLDQIAASINSQANGSGVTAKVVLDTNGAYHLQVSNGMNAMTITDNAGLGFTNGTVNPLPTSQLTASLASSLGIANQAETDLSNLQQNISNTSNQLSSAYQQQTNFVTYLQTSLSGVKDVDTAKAASLVQQYQTQLQASYLAVSSLTKLSLAQFL
jgi:flagellar hook-associated protein 3 FlgL